MGDYSYKEMAVVAGFDGFINPTCLILGDPEIMRIYPAECPFGRVCIDRSKLGDWGTKDKPVPLQGVGWLKTIKEFIAPPVIPPQP
ncbi:hypothetical protein COCOBI_04-1510 [Coccomyxa sp. Obi]|nr:hypothetical protein COCOBI_04-1510 [Coccomyxa sp. Obi]